MIRVGVHLVSITTTGFTAKVITRSNSRIFNVTITWLAYVD
jgi:hypothetical protein